jgi:hypothetical protein
MWRGKASPAALLPHIRVEATLLLFADVPGQIAPLIVMLDAGQPPHPPSLPSRENLVSSTFKILCF